MKPALRFSPYRLFCICTHLLALCVNASGDIFNPAVCEVPLLSNDIPGGGGGMPGGGGGMPGKPGGGGGKLDIFGGENTSSDSEKFQSRVLTNAHDQYCVTF